ncbi:MAG TPA: HlyD family efflux transporter periplasmic adaptor subunit [Bryobacteraceae bacterium]|jgi:HlyD family secretion protein|nr:HlyD family efflux transporter periplasmic adaptor subunit [Bryobacteraceae bacterium]
MDIQRKNVGRKKAIRWVVAIVIILGVVGGTTLALGKLKPAAPGVPGSTLWPGTVKRGPMVLEVSGIGTLVPEDTMVIPAQTAGRIERIVIQPGNPVKADSVVMILSSPELESQLHDAEATQHGAEADYQTLKATLQKARLDLESQASQTKADLATAHLQADRDQQLLKNGLISDIDAKISTEKANQLQQQYEFQQQRIAVTKGADESQLAAQQTRVDQYKGQYDLKKSQVDQLKVRAGFDGMLEALATPVEAGQNVTAGTPLGKVAQPTHLKAELKIAETQVKDVAPGQLAIIDTRLAGGESNGLVEGRVSRIDTSIINGTVTVDVSLKGTLPHGARPDLSVDGKIELMRLNDVVYVDRPVFGQQDSTVTIFKYDADGRYASKVKVTFGRASVNTIEIKSGLNVGDKVILSDMSTYDSYDRIKIE